MDIYSPIHFLLLSGACFVTLDATLIHRARIIAFVHMPSCLYLKKIELLVLSLSLSLVRAHISLLKLNGM